MTYTVTSRTRLHRFAEKDNHQHNSEVHNDPVTKISDVYVCSNPNTFLVRQRKLRDILSLDGLHYLICLSVFNLVSERPAPVGSRGVSRIT